MPVAPVLLSLLLAAPAAATKPPRPAAAAGKATRAAVEARLRASEVSAPADWSAVGARADEVLVALAGDSKVDLQLRGRAVTALGFFPTVASRRFLERTIDHKAAATEPSERLLLRKAAVALGWVGGTAVPARLGPLLASADPEVRLDAAIALGLTRLPEAADHLRKRLPDETVPRVRQQIGRQLRVIEDATIATGRGGTAGAPPIVPGNRGAPSPIPAPVPGSPAAPPRGQ